MNTLILAFVLAVAASAVVTPLVRVMAVRVGAISAPGGRHHHGRRVPRLGGVAILVGFATPLAVLTCIRSPGAAVLLDDLHRVGALVVGSLAMCAVGFLDDTRRVRAKTKLYVQLAVAALAWAGGFRINAIELPFLGVLPMGAFALPITMAWIVGITNAINLIDGLDGLAGGVVFFAALTNLIVAYVAGTTFVALLMACTLGSVLGFLFYNFNPARIFMGDSGSYFLGFILATTALAASHKASTAVSILVPVLALGVPIFDTLFAMVRRYLERRPMFSADRGHIHHRLLDMGITHRRAVLLLYGASLFLAIGAIGISLGRSWAIGGVILAMSVAVTGALRFATSFSVALRARRQKSRLRSPHAERLRVLVPELPALFEAARSEADVWKILTEAVERAALVRIEVLDSPAEHEGNVVLTLQTTAHGDPASLDLVRARYPLGAEGRARASMRFSWHGDSADVSPQEEILLQLIVDLCARRLERIASALAPRPAPSGQASRSPAGVPVPS